jgi:amphi-Trp domain-containing protein
MSGKGKFSYSATIEATRAAEHLTRIADGLLAGTISLTAEGDRIDLTPSDIVRIEIGASRNADKNRGRIVVALSWKATIETPPGTLEIATEPAPAPAPAAEPA